ncbi:MULTISPECIES: type I-B CRISPR-associated endonuclease Cas1b [Desulfobacula]|uniref:CRISPR-associated endonuclease Cas1 n=2 Tax=Desulfobacula TaxID=28222 RepID=K0NE73_DESTT|nr:MULTISPECIES: type I-B CRISPR-associated endonuclease Cas1b [Desulfobacula]CCK79130.1 CRISPR-associated protein, Cas1 family [Desulfobacula toluolica Tol2]SDU06302.1 CRISP-associated protein Cas1 [Desulfobacula phenolica]
MKQSLYLFSNSTIKRKDNSLMFEIDGEKKYRPVESICDLFLFNEHTLNTKLLNFLGQQKIPVHIFNYYGFYSGSFVPREQYLSGHVTISQAKHYLDDKKRMVLAYELLNAAASNIITNLTYYKNRERDIGEKILKIKELKKSLKNADSISYLMGIEGNIRDLYYSAFNEIVQNKVEFKKRIKRPPDNFINSLISFGNSLVYTTVLSEIYRTQLDPTVSFLHEPGYRRYSLALDISEIFKPILLDRMIFTMINKKELTEKDTDKDLNYCYLKDQGRMKFLRKYDERLKKTIKHKKLNRNVSYKRLIRLECYKIVKHILGEEKYTGFKMWW